MVSRTRGCSRGGGGRRREDDDASGASIIGCAVMKDSGGGWRQHAEETRDEQYGAKFAWAVGGLRVEERPLGLAERAAGDRVNRKYEL